MYTGYNQYETMLTPQDERAFQNWFYNNKIHGNIPVYDNGYDYDYRGAYKSGFNADNAKHWGDTYKKPWHRTISKYSQYTPNINADWYLQNIYFNAKNLLPNYSKNLIRDLDY